MLPQIILKLTKTPRLTADSIDRVKRAIAYSNHKPAPHTADLLRTYRDLVARKKIKQFPTLERLLQKRAVRTASGVAIVTVLTKPWPCPGKCVYCPQEAGMPKSYLKDEPAAQRAYFNRFDPYAQVISRLNMLYNNGHPIDKIELIVKGGSWNAYPLKYQAWFVSRCFEAANDSLQPAYAKASAGRHYNTTTLQHPTRTRYHITHNNETLPTSRQAIEQLNNKLLIGQKKNEKAGCRIVGLTLETRPDLITEETIKQMRVLGCTRIELGVQHTDDQILKLIKRGHTIADTKKATALLRDYGLKIDYHLMPQLPGSTPKKDYEMIKQIFDDPDLRPDMIKIYPCTVVPGSELCGWYKRGKYKPYSTKKLVELLIKVKSELIPYYCRISRLIRDIPSTHIIAGNKVTNLREVVQLEMARRNLRCKCLRCREVGHQDPSSSALGGLRSAGTTTPRLFVERYRASEGEEYFLSYEDSRRKTVYAFCRLRIIKAMSAQGGSAYGGKQYNNETLYGAFVRELHTYWHMATLKHCNTTTLQHSDIVQHTGLGKKLLAEAEKIAKKNGVKKIAVISGVGVREYYRKLGYKLENGYMVKWLSVQLS